MLWLRVLAAIIGTGSASAAAVVLFTGAEVCGFAALAQYVLGMGLIIVSALAWIVVLTAGFESQTDEKDML